MKNVLIVEDDKRLNETLSEALSERYAISRAHNLKEANTLTATNRYDAVISDFRLPDGNGDNVVTLINSMSPRPKLFFITAYAEKDMLIRLLNQGVAGLFEKPFDLESMLSKLDVNLSGVEIVEAQGEYTLHPFTKTLEVGSEMIALTDVEYKIFSLLLAKKNLWVTRREIIEAIWGSAALSRNALDTHLSNLKRKLPFLKDQLEVGRNRGLIFKCS